MPPSLLAAARLNKHPADDDDPGRHDLPGQGLHHRRRRRRSAGHRHRQAPGRPRRSLRHPAGGRGAGRSPSARSSSRSTSAKPARPRQGYAKELTEEQLPNSGRPWPRSAPKRHRHHHRQALRPQGPRPHHRDMVPGMKPGQRGRRHGGRNRRQRRRLRPGEEVDVNGVTIIGLGQPRSLASPPTPARCIPATSPTSSSISGTRKPRPSTSASRTKSSKAAWSPTTARLVHPSFKARASAPPDAGTRNDAGEMDPPTFRLRARDLSRVELISKVPSQLHTPLMSGSNAISGITIVGALLPRCETGGGNRLTVILGIRRRDPRHHQRGRRLPGDRPHAGHVQEEGTASNHGNRFIQPGLHRRLRPVHFGLKMLGSAATARRGNLSPPSACCSPSSPPCRPANLLQWIISAASPRRHDRRRSPPRSAFP
jgi:hypothetical protein